MLVRKTGTPTKPSFGTKRLPSSKGRKFAWPKVLPDEGLGMDFEGDTVNWRVWDGEYREIPVKISSANPHR